MKVSRREGFLLVLVLAAGACYLLYAFLFSPMFKNIMEARAELGASQTRLAAYEQMVADGSLEKLEKQQQEAVTVVEEKAAPLLPNLDHNRILSFIDNIAKSQNIQLFAVTFGDQLLFDTAPKADNTAVDTYPLGVMAEAFRAEPGAEPVPAPTPAAQPGATPAVSQAVVNKLTADVLLSNITYPQVMGFIKKLESYNRSIYLENLVIGLQTTETGTVMQASLTYTFMQTDKLTDTDEGLSPNPNLTGTGKADPFR